MGGESSPKLQNAARARLPPARRGHLPFSHPHPNSGAEEEAGYVSAPTSPLADAPSFSTTGHPRASFPSTRSRGPLLRGRPSRRGIASSWSQRDMARVLAPSNPRSGPETLASAHDSFLGPHRPRETGPWRGLAEPTRSARRAENVTEQQSPRGSPRSGAGSCVLFTSAFCFGAAGSSDAGSRQPPARLGQRGAGL